MSTERQLALGYSIGGCMKKTRILLTGATGTMGFSVLKELVSELEQFELHLLIRKNDSRIDLIKPYEKLKGLTITWGDLTNDQDVFMCVKDADIILHVAAFVSPAADYQPLLAMKTNFGSTKNILSAIREQKRENEVKFVYIGTVAETGDRMPPIHYGRVGDPIKPSIFDYYAVSKVAAERLVIESGIKYWVSLRQTGIIGPAMSKITDPIMFHNGLNNVLEYVSDRDSGRMLKNLCVLEESKELSPEFWGHIYNIGGGGSCRVDTLTMFEEIFGAIGFTNLDNVISPKWFATKNFHGQYYLDSDVLEGYLHFRKDSMQYFYEEYIKNLGITASLSKAICKMPGGQKLMGSVIKRMFLKMAKTEHGTVHFIENKMEDQISAYWGSRKEWEEIPDSIYDLKKSTELNKVIKLDHGYEEDKPKSKLTLSDMKEATRFRGGRLNSTTMTQGDWLTPLFITCAFGHDFIASPKLTLEGGHWCPVCERTSWNYGKRAKVDSFFAQVWNPLHDKENEKEYRKEVNELMV